MTNKKINLIFDLIVYLLAGAAGFSWMTSHPDAPILLMLIAGAIDKYLKPILIFL